MPELTQIKLVNGVTYDIADAKCRDNMPKSLIDLKEDAKSVHITQYEKNKWNGINEKMPFNFGVDGDKYGYYNSKGELIPFGSSEEQPFKLGIDNEGNYGYIKNGETDVTPFVQSPSGGTLKFTKLFEVRNASNSNIIKDEYDEYHMELSFEGDGDGGFRLEDTVSMIGKTSNKMICKDSNGKRVIYNFNTGKVSFPDGGYGTDNGTPVNPRPDGNYKWVGVYSHVPDTDIYVDGDCYIVKRPPTNSWIFFVTSKDQTSFNNYIRTPDSFSVSSVVHSPIRSFENCNVFCTEVNANVSLSKSYADFVVDQDDVYGWIENNQNLFTDENGNFTIKNPWKVTMYGITKSSTSDSSVDNLPFKFGIDENGNYGYYKVGADTVTPFKSGNDGGGYTIANGDFEKLFETRVATVSHIIDKNYIEYLMELSLERNSQFILEDSTLVVGSNYSDITCKNGDGNRVIYNFETGLISLPDGGYGISNGEPVNPRADVAYKWFLVYSHVPNRDFYVDGECYIIRYSNDRSFWFVTSKDKTTLNFWYNDGSGLQWSGSINSPRATYGNCNVFYKEEYSTTSDLAYYVDFVTDDPALNFIQNNLSLFTDEDGNFTMKNPWKVTMYGKTDSKSKKGNIDILGIADYVEEE